MPIYEYRCKDCHQVFEEWIKHVEEEGVEHACPICTGHAERIISNTTFALKGSGWYVTDYGPRSSHKGAGSADASASSDTAAAPAAAPADSGSKAAPAAPAAGAACGV